MKTLKILSLEFYRKYYTINNNYISSKLTSSLFSLCYLLIVSSDKDIL